MELTTHGVWRRDYVWSCTPYLTTELWRYLVVSVAIDPSYYGKLSGNSKMNCNQVKSSTRFINLKDFWDFFKISNILKDLYIYLEIYINFLTDLDNSRSRQNRLYKLRFFGFLNIYNKD